MPHICPRPCSRLAAAAVFISVGVVQFVVGIILLRSKYVYLLAGPDFWTSSCNIAVGCLLGLSASVWKQSRKRQTKDHLIRRNLLLALLFSSLILNATTLGILLLGEGNALVSIRLENNGKYSDSTFASEVLAYAYVTSVCCPIVCIVISIVSMSGSCFTHASRKKSRELKTPLKSILKDRSRSLRWIYTPELLDLSKKKIRELVLSSTSESSSEDELVTPMQQKYEGSSEDIQLVLNRMAQGKRDSILSDSAVMLKQLDQRRKNRYNSSNQEGSYIIPELSRSRESALNKMRFPEYNSTRYDESSFKRSEKPRRDYTDVNENTHVPSDVALKTFRCSKSNGSMYRNPCASEELLNEYQRASSQLTEHFPSQYRKFRGRVRARSEVNGPSLSCISDVTDYESKTSDDVYKKMAKKSESEPRSMTVTADCLDQQPNHESFSGNSEVIEDNEENRSFEIPKETTPAINDYFSPDGSEFDDDSRFDFARTSSWAGEVVPISIQHSSVARLSNKLIPVPSPVVPAIHQKLEAPSTSDDSGIGTMESNSFTEVTSQNDFKSRKSNLSSFREDSKFGNKENTQQYPKIGSQSTKKYDLNRVSTMASISEEPNSELNRFDESEESTRSQDEAVHTASKSHSRKKSPSVRLEVSKGPNLAENNSERDITPKRKNASGKSLRRIWSVVLSENQADILGQVVDQDSLIGLTEEELIARQFRTRSIRKAVQQRIKEEIAV